MPNIIPSESVVIHSLLHYITGHLLSFSGLLIHHSIPTLKAANPTALHRTAVGPCFLASNAPVMAPAATALFMSFFPLRLSTQHSVPANNNPMVPKFLPDETAVRRMSWKPILSCWRRGRSVTGTAGWPGALGVERGVSYRICIYH